MKAAYFLVVGMALSSCGQPSPKAQTSLPASHVAAAQVPAPNKYPVTIVANTPDLAVKSWWRVRDADADYEHDLCLRQKLETSPLVINAAKITTGDLKAFYDPNRTECSKEEYDRTIEEVKVESDSRATVMATIKNNTPIPQSLRLEDWEQKSREKGEKFKYILERISAQDSWHVAQVYEYQDYAIAGSNWRIEYDPKYRSSHALVLGQ